LAELTALEFAKYKRSLSDEEHLIGALCRSKKRLAMKTHKPHGDGLAAFLADATQSQDEEYLAAKADYERWEKLVCSVFIKAVLAHDRDKIIKLADAAAFWKDKVGLEGEPKDPVRAKLLKIKMGSAFEHGGEIRNIAKKVYSRQQFESCSVNGFSRLKDVCREIGLRFSLRGHQSKRKNKR
jgi:hypothetical protein